jgi:hypothetical protein
VLLAFGVEVASRALEVRRFALAHRVDVEVGGVKMKSYSLKTTALRFSSSGNSRMTSRNPQGPTIKRLSPFFSST